MKRTTKQPLAFATALAVGMDRVGHTDETLSQATGFAPDTIYRYRTGRFVPPRRTRKVLMQAIAARKTY